MLSFTRVITPLLILCVVACSGGTSAPNPSGTVRFTSDASTCLSSVAEGYTFYADGNALGTAALSAGQSQTYTVNAGQHVFGVTVNVNHLALANVSGAVAAGATFNYLITCIRG